MSRAPDWPLRASHTHALAPRRAREVGARHPQPSRALSRTFCFPTHLRAAGAAARGLRGWSGGSRLLSYDKGFAAVHLPSCGPPIYLLLG
ncbi:hypothetical protein U0070_013601 [Myodes glareolus]|uniref:Uncharacterized protein n=1 Tax=Myodes glareolus TaxID=447135 RepID=A0AAW0JMC0_MYOGA